MGLSPKKYTFAVGCFVALGSILFGYDLGVIAGVLVAQNFLDTTGNPDADYLGFIVSALLLGAFAGCVPAGLLADRLGRRWAIVVGSIIFLLGGALQTAAMNREMMIAGRFFAGMGIGFLSFLAPLYQSEIAHPSIRGMLTTLQQLFLGIGAFVASFCVYGMEVHHKGTAAQWRFPLGLQMAPCVPLLTMIFLFPESPRWLMSKGRDNEALQSLARLHANGNTQDTLVIAEIAEIRAALAHERQVETGWMSLITNKSFFRRVMMGVVLQFSVQMTGVSLIQYYAPAIYAAVGFGPERSLLFQSISSVIAIIAQLSCVLFVDRLGRRWPLIIANIAIGIIFIITTIIQALYPAASGNTSAAYAYIAMIFIFQWAFSCAVGPLSWAYPVEILNSSIRAKGTAITSMSCWIANFMIAQVSPKALESIGWRFYIVFCVCGFTNALPCHFLLTVLPRLNCSSRCGCVLGSSTAEFAARA